jgi:uncharacterized protein
VTARVPLVGIGYRHPIGDWIRAHLDRFDVLEVTVDHYLYGGPHMRAALEMLARSVPIVAHGVRLSLGTDAPLDEAYVREVAKVVRILGAPRYSEHLAFTKVPGLDLANLLPLPKTPEIVEHAADKVRRVRALLPVPFDLENISYLFDWPDSWMSDGQFLSAVCEAAGAGVLLDVENVYVNAHNHGFDASAGLAEIPVGLVRSMHVAGGFSAGDLLVDSHDHPVPDGALELLVRALARFGPETIVIERDDRIEAFEEILSDVARVRACLTTPADYALSRPAQPSSRARRASVDLTLIERQRALLEFLTNPRAELDAAPLDGLDGDRLRLVRDLSIEKRLDKVRASFPVTLAHLDQALDALCAEFTAAFPPHDIGRAENAQQFAEFLAAHWERVPPRRAYLRDLVRIELAMTQARRAFEGGTAGPPAGARPAVRRPASAQLLHCAHDVRPLFGPTPDASEPARRAVWLVVLPPTAGDGGAGGTPRVLEISAELHAALRALDEWRAFDGADPLGIGAPADVAKRLVALGALEVAE